MLIIRTSHLNQNMITYSEPQIMSIQVITHSLILASSYLAWFQTKNILTHPLFYEYPDA